MTRSTKAGEAVYDIIVIGGGMAGISIACELAVDHSVALVEKESSLAYHSTGRSAAASFESYGNTAIRTLTAASRSFFINPGDDFHSPLATQLPMLVIAAEGETGALRSMHNKVSTKNSHVELVDGRVAEELNPTLKRDYTQLAMIDASGLQLDVHALHQGYVRGLRRHGGTILQSADIESGRRHGATWTLQTAEGHTLYATTVINAAGAWCDHVAGILGARPVGIRPLRRTAFMVSNRTGHSEGLPITMSATESFYFKPEGTQFVCSPAEETLQAPCDARADDLEIARSIELLNQATNLDIRHVNSSWGGLRSFVPDRTPVIGPDPEIENLFWYAGQGGYGIQIAPAMARMGAALVSGQPIPNDLATLGVTEGMLSRTRKSLDAPPAVT